MILANIETRQKDELKAQPPNNKSDFTCRFNTTYEMKIFGSQYFCLTSKNSAGKHLVNASGAQKTKPSIELAIKKLLKTKSPQLLKTRLLENLSSIKETLLARSKPNVIHIEPLVQKNHIREISNLTKQKNELTKGLQKVTGENEELKRENRFLIENLQEIVTDNDKSEKKCSELQEKVNLLINEINSSKETMNSLLNEVELLKTFQNDNPSNNVLVRLINDKSLELQKAKLTIAELKKEVEALGYDSLTGLHLRKTGTEIFHTLISVTSRNKDSNLIILMIDLDRFKGLNDSLGHETGDNCLRLVASILKDFGLRDSDLIIRWGGEEFLGVFRLGLNEGIKKAENIRKDIEQKLVDYKFTTKDDLSTVHTPTCSIGVYCHQFQEENKMSNEELAKLLSHRADLAAYWSKLIGRNASSSFETMVQEINITRELEKHQVLSIAKISEFSPNDLKPYVRKYLERINKQKKELTLFLEQKAQALLN